MAEELRRGDPPNPAAPAVSTEHPPSPGLGGAGSDPPATGSRPEEPPPELRSQAPAVAHETVGAVAPGFEGATLEALPEGLFEPDPVLPRLSDERSGAEGENLGGSEPAPPEGLLGDAHPLPGLHLPLAAQVLPAENPAWTNAGSTKPALEELPQSGERLPPSGEMVLPLTEVARAAPDRFEPGSFPKAPLSSISPVFAERSPSRQVIEGSSSVVLAPEEVRLNPLVAPTLPASFPGWRPNLPLWWRRKREKPNVDSEPGHSGQVHEGPLHQVAAPARPKLSGRERRWLRRRRRLVFEEVLAWILVPLILIGAYWLMKTILTAMGTSPTALIEGLKAALQGLERR